MTPLGDNAIGNISSWLRGLSRRQQAISNNIANIDTPGYQRQEVAFESELRREIAGGSEQQLTTTDPRHVAAGSRLRSQLGVDPAQMLTSSRIDQNNVDIDQEMISLAETQMRYQAAANALNIKLGTLKEVIRG